MLYFVQNFTFRNKNGKETDTSAYIGVYVIYALPYVHGKHLRSCRDGQLLNHIVHGQAFRGSLPISFANN